MADKVVLIRKPKQRNGQTVSFAFEAIRYNGANAEQLREFCGASDFSPDADGLVLNIPSYCDDVTRVPVGGYLSHGRAQSTGRAVFCATSKEDAESDFIVVDYMSFSAGAVRARAGTLRSKDGSR